MVERIGGTTRTIEGEKVQWESATPLGGARDIRLISGIDGMVYELGAISRDIRNTAQSLSIIADRTQQMYGSSHTGGITEQMKAVVAETLQEATGGEPVPAAQSPVPNAATPQPPEPAPNPLANWEEYQRRANYFKDPRTGGFSLGNARQTFGQTVQQGMDNWTAASPEFAKKFVQNDQNRWVDAVTGRAAPRAALQAYLNRSAVTGAVRGGAEALAQGATFRQAGMAALPAGVAKFAGGVGAALFAANAAGDFVEGQRAENAQWQRMMGGTNLEQLEERAGSRVFGMSQFGMMDSAEAQRLYQGVAAAGLRGDERTEAQDFAMQNYSELGMTIDQSLRFIKLSAKSGTDSLDDFAVALRKVSEDAKEAGTNTEIARENLMNMIESLTPTVGDEAATGVAAGLSMAGQGENLEGVSFKRVGSSEHISRLAGQMGKTVDQFRAEISQTSGQALVDAQQVELRRILDNALGRSGRQIVIDWARSRTDPSAPVSNNEGEELRQLLVDAGISFNSDAILQTLQSLGMADGLDHSNLWAFVGGIYGGSIDFTAQGFEHQQEVETEEQRQVAEEQAASERSAAWEEQKTTPPTSGAVNIGGGGLTPEMSDEERQLIMEDMGMTAPTVRGGEKVGVTAATHISGSVVIAPTDELRRLLRPVGNDGVAHWNTDGDLEPPPPHVTPRTRPTGNP